MARKRRKKAQTDPIQALVILLMLGSFFGMFKWTNSLVAASISAGCVLGMYAVIVILYNQKQTERLKKSGIKEIDKMEGRQFEIYLGHLFRMHNYVVEVTQATGDFGADLVIKKGSQKIVVQAKRYGKNVGLKAVQEIRAALDHYGAAEAWVVTNRDYTEQAYTLAKSNGVRLINREQLIAMILAVNPKNKSGRQPSSQPEKEATPEAAAAVAATEAAASTEEPDDLECPKCGYLLVKRNSKRGEFYGCSNFPKCRHTRTINEAAENV
ncbi:restriction endonuclease [Paenibacillus gorillae]|uniref:restriction endonuclease n=1 Tax=Paenibacillus gorillae TaxID=1243662 RepID=UPI0005A639EE|nr:restriction endonuclease [Paenibacillus gorillae]